MSQYQFEILARDTLYQGFFRLERYTVKHTLFGGGWSEPVQRELFRRGECVAVLLYDPDRDEVVVIEQFRIGAVLYPQRAWLLEIVAGAIEPGETAAEVAHRESWEEAGCRLSELTEIQRFYTTPGGCSERITLFYGRIDARTVGGIHGLADEQEDIRVVALPFTEAYQWLLDGKIESAIPIIALQWLYINRPKLMSGLRNG
jgi:ADP-ribose pyrophosphatase